MTTTRLGRSAPDPLDELSSVFSSESKSEQTGHKFRGTTSINPRSRAFAAGTMMAVSGSLSSAQGIDFGHISKDQPLKPSTGSTLVMPDGFYASREQTGEETSGKLGPAALPDAFRDFSRERRTDSRLLKGAVAKGIRAPFVAQILSSLTKLSVCADQPQGALHIDKIFGQVKALSDLAPFDSFTRLALAFYDSLAFENRWMSYSEEQS